MKKGNSSIAHRYALNRIKTQSIRQLFVNSFGGAWTYFGSKSCDSSKALHLVLLFSAPHGKNFPISSVPNGGGITQAARHFHLEYPIFFAARTSVTNIAKSFRR